MNFWEFFKLKKSDLPKNRVSEDENASGYAGSAKSIFSNKTIDPKYPRHLIPMIEMATVFNPRISQAVESFVTLGNTGHTLTVEGPEKDKALTELIRLAESINTDQLVNQLILQILVGGAISIEMVINETITGIKAIERVPIRDIYFKLVDNEYRPYQWPNGIVQPIELNINTYRYIPIMTIDGSPYGTPPFLSALGPMEVQNDFREQLRNVAKQLGLMGIFDYSVAEPEKKPGETEKEFYDRVINYLDTIADSVSKGLSNGLIVKFKGTELTHHETTKGFQGVADIIKQNEKWLMSGAKINPSILGESEGSTETWANIAYEQFIQQVGNYQRIIKRSLEDIYRTHLMLGNYKYHQVRVDFKKALPPLNPSRDAEILEKKANAVAALVDREVINKAEARKIIGLEP